MHGINFRDSSAGTSSINLVSKICPIGMYYDDSLSSCQGKTLVTSQHAILSALNARMQAILTVAGVTLQQLSLLLGFLELATSAMTVAPLAMVLLKKIVSPVRLGLYRCLTTDRVENARQAVALFHFWFMFP